MALCHVESKFANEKLRPVSDQWFIHLIADVGSVTDDMDLDLNTVVAYKKVTMG
jgi:hypothetical protein